MGFPQTFERRLFYFFGRHIWNIAGVSGFIALLAGLIVFGDSFNEGKIKSRRQYFGRDYPTLESKEKFFGKEYPTLKTEQEYFGKNYLTLKTKSEYFPNQLLTNENIKMLTINSGKIKPYKKWINEEKGKSYKDYSNFLLTVPPTANLSDLNNMYDNYKKKKYDSYLLNNIPNELIVKQKEQENTYKSYKLSQSKKLRAQNQKYDNYSLGILNQQNLLSNKYKNYKTSIQQKQFALENEYEEYTSRVNLKNSLLPIQRLTSSMVMGWGLGVVAFSSIISSVFSIERNTRKVD